MYKTKHYYFYFIIFLITLSLALFILLINFYNKNNSIIKCNMKYALCAAAKCLPNPNDNSEAFCFCDVLTGKNYSVGNNNCQNIKPYNTETGEEIIFSVFSPIIQKMGYHKVMCPPEEVNLNCMNKICSVDPNNPTKAVCICAKTDNKGLNWVAFHKNGQPKTCNYESGAASEKKNTKLQEFIKQNP